MKKSRSFLRRTADGIGINNIGKTRARENKGLEGVQVSGSGVKFLSLGRN